MARIKPFLSKIAKEDLIHYVAINGENYDKYVAYANLRGFKVFSKYYLHNWVQRHRTAIQIARRQHLIEVKKTSVMDRQARLNYLEQNVRKVDELIAGEDDPERLLKLMEQQRKLLQAVAQERGEWNQKDDGSQDLRETHEKILELMAKGQQKSLPDPDVVEGEAREI